MTIIHTTHSRYVITGLIKQGTGWKVFIEDTTKLKEFSIDILYNDFVDYLAEIMFSSFGKIARVKAETYILSEPFNVLDYLKDYTFSKL